MGKIRVSCLWAVCLAGVVSRPVFLYAQKAPPAVSPRRESEQALKKQLPAGYQSGNVPSRMVELEPIPVQSQRSQRGLRRVGVRRTLPPGIWNGVKAETAAGGATMYRIQVHSPGARGIRLHFTNFSVGSGSVWVYAQPAQDQAHKLVFGPYTDQGPFHDGTFWTGTVQSDSVIVEFDETAAHGESQPFPPFRMDSLAHQWSAYSVAPSDSTAASCELDVSCYANWTGYASAVADYDFMGDDGGYYSCSGSMVITQAQTFKPYFLSAHHCASSSSEARSVEAVFSYQTASCNGTPPDAASLPTVVGATYLTGAPIGDGDFALMLLSAAPPGGTTFLGWNANDPSFSEALTAIHHPNGSWARISFGNRVADADITVGTDDGPALDYYQVQLNQGITEPGSSGSPLLSSQGEIYGSLTGGPLNATGPAACQIHPFDVSYGRFSAAYPYLAPYLNDSASSAVNGASFLSGGAPGMLLSVFGTDLATGIQEASAVPLPQSMHGTTATVNGIAAPLFYVSPGQVNLQVPYEIPPGSATVSVRSGDGHVTTQTVQVSGVSPGIFTTADGTFHLVPSASARRGSYATLFFTGQGQVNPRVADGAAPPPPSRVGVAGLPVPVQPVTVYVGGVAAQTTFTGIPYYLVGVTQVNFLVPPGVSAGDQPVVVAAGNAVSGTAFLTVQ